MKRLPLLLGLLLLIGTASAVPGAVETHYPPYLNYNYTNASSTHSANFSAWNAVNLTKSLNGTWGNNSWMSQAGTNSSQRFNIDLGDYYNINQIYYENQHNSGTFTNTSVKNITFWGSNSPESFNNFSYSNDTGWTQLTLNGTAFLQHVAADTVDPHAMEVVNNSAWYRYYSFKFANNYGNYSYMGVRRIGLQSQLSWNYTGAGTYIWQAPANLTEVTLQLIGGGGGGRSGAGTEAAGGGGYVGGSQTVIRAPVTSGTNYTIVIGAGGANQTLSVCTNSANAGTGSSALGYSVSGGAGGPGGCYHCDGGNGATGLWTSVKYAFNGQNSTYKLGGQGGIGYGAGGGGGGAMTYYTGEICGAGMAGADGAALITSGDVLNYNIPEFTANPATAVAGSLVQFSDDSYIANRTSLSYNWSFGDGSYSGTNGSVNHVYSYTGIYTVKLNLTNAGQIPESITKTDYITILGTNPITWYSPNQVRFTVLNYVGSNVVGARVNATYIESTMPEATAWLQSIYGVDSSIATQMLSSNTTMSGVTGSDGAVVFTMHSSLQYNITATNGSTVVSTLLYPKEADYNIWLPPPTVENLYEQVNATLQVTEPNASYFTMSTDYQDHAAKTSSLLFYVNASNGTPVYSTTVAPGSEITTLNYTLPNVRGNSYYYGIRATRTDGNVSLDQGVTNKGPSGVLVDLRLPSATYYPWIALFILFLVTSLSSKNNIRFMALLMPILAAMFWWFGWMNGAYLASVIPFACLLGAVYYMKGSLRENYGVGGAGSMLLNIVVFLIIMQMMIGFINGMGVFNQTAQMTPSNEFSNLDLTTIRNDTQNFGGINDPLQSANSFASIGWATIKIALQMIGAVFIVGYFLTEMFPYVPVGFFAIIQCGIWVLYVLFILKLVGKSGTESDF